MVSQKLMEGKRLTGRLKRQTKKFASTIQKQFSDIASFSPNFFFFACAKGQLASQRADVVFQVQKKDEMMNMQSHSHDNTIVFVAVLYL